MALVDATPSEVVVRARRRLGLLSIVVAAMAVIASTSRSGDVTVAAGPVLVAGEARVRDRAAGSPTGPRQSRTDEIGMVLFGSTLVTLGVALRRGPRRAHLESGTSPMR
jgi:hypothetical protein